MLQKDNLRTFVVLTSVYRCMSVVVQLRSNHTQILIMDSLHRHAGLWKETGYEKKINPTPLIIPMSLGEI